MDGSSLVLKGLTASDSGAYTCMAQNVAGEDARLHTVNVLGELQGTRDEEKQVASLSQDYSSLALVGPSLGNLEGDERVGAGGLVQGPAMPTLGPATG